MTVDAEGCLWVAFWDGWCAALFARRRSAPDCRSPVQRPTSCASAARAWPPRHFARIGIEGTDLDKQPLAGGLFAVDVGVHGLAELPFAG